MKHHSLWQFDDRMAHLAWGEDRAQVDLRAPTRGVQLLSAGSTEVALEMLGVDLVDVNPELSDVFVRGGDLVATYEQTATRPARVQVYWRHMASTMEQVTFDLIVSVQTSLLESWPSLWTRSTLAAATVQRLSDDTPKVETLALDRSIEFARDREHTIGCLGYALNEQPAGYVEMIHPSDFWRGSLVRVDEKAARTRCGWELFPQHLEKGVILRARLRGVVLRTAPSAATLAELHDTFLAEKLPLTV